CGRRTQRLLRIRGQLARVEGIVLLRARGAERRRAGDFESGVGGLTRGAGTLACRVETPLKSLVGRPPWGAGPLGRPDDFQEQPKPARAPAAAQGGRPTKLFPALRCLG